MELLLQTIIEYINDNYPQWETNKTTSYILRLKHKDYVQIWLFIHNDTLDIQYGDLTNIGAYQIGYNESNILQTIDDMMHKATKYTTTTT